MASAQERLWLQLLHFKEGRTFVIVGAVAETPTAGRVRQLLFHSLCHHARCADSP